MNIFAGNSGHYILVIYFLSPQVKRELISSITDFSWVETGERDQGTPFFNKVSLNQTL